MIFNPIKDQSLSSEVEEWLKTNKPTVIPRGVSTATGYTPPAPSERSEKESAKHRAEINRLVRQQQKAEALAAKEAEAKRARLEKIKRTAEAHAQVVELINEFRSKMGYGDLGRLAKKIGVCTETITNWTFGRTKTNEAMLEKLKEAVAGFEYNHREKQTREVTLQKRRIRERKQREKNPDVVRKRTLASAKREAVEQCVKKFSGPCKVHGMTEYRIVGDRARCVECEREKQQRKYEQMQENLKKMKYCLKYGKNHSLAHATHMASQNSTLTSQVTIGCIDATCAVKQRISDNVKRSRLQTHSVTASLTVKWQSPCTQQTQTTALFSACA